MPAETFLGGTGTVTAEELDRRVAERRQEQRAAAETLMLLETLQDKAPIGLGFVDRDLRLVRLNDALAAVVGTTVAAQTGRRVQDLTPDIWPQLQPLYRHVLDGGPAVLNVEVDRSAAPRPADRRRWMASFYPVTLDDEVIGVGLVVVDVTESRKAGEAMRFQAALLGAVGQAVIATDPAGLVLYWNQAAEQMYGWSAAEALGRAVRDLIGSAHTVDAGNEILAGVHRGQAWSGDFSVRRRDGMRFWVHVTDTPVFGPDGSLVAVIGVSADSTDRMAGEQARRRLSAFVDGSGDAIFGTTVDGVITDWNPAAERLFGYGAAEIIGCHVSSSRRKAGRTSRSPFGRRWSGGPTQRLETVRRCRDGTTVEVLMTSSRATDDAGRVVGLSVIAQDITVRLGTQRALEASRRQLAEAQRIAHLGSFEFEIVTGGLTWSEEHFRILGLDPGVAPSPKLFILMVHSEDRLRVPRAWSDARHQGHAFDLVFRIVLGDGQERWVHGRGEADRAADGSVAKLAGTLMDDTFQIGSDRCAGRPRPASRSVSSRPVSAPPSSISRGAHPGEHGGVHPARPAGRRLDRPVMGRVQPSRRRAARTGGARALAAGHDTYDDERRYVRPDGSIVWALLHLTLVRDEAGEPQYYFSQLQDITGRKQMEEELAHQALHDSLTGLPNRALLTDRLIHGLAGTRRRGTHLGVMFLDVDHFKVVNDSLGHGFGDALLRQAARASAPPSARATPWPASAATSLSSSATTSPPSTWRRSPRTSSTPSASRT